MPTGKKNPKGDGMVMPFHILASGTVTTNVAAFSVSPSSLSSFQTRLTTEADSWTKFRFQNMKFRLHPNGTSYAVAYVPGVQDANTFASAAAAMEVVPCAYMASTTTDPSEWIHVPSEDLRGVFPWYKSIAGGADSTEEAPGQLSIYSGNASGAYLIEIRGRIEFAGSVPPANTPEELALLRALRLKREKEVRERERAGLLSVLSGGSQTAPPSGLKLNL